MDAIAEFAQEFPAWWLGIFALLGAIVGSFMNVVICRLPLVLEQRWRRETYLRSGVPLSAARSRYNLCWPPSHCPDCQHTLAVRDNIPVFGWLLLRGISRCCQRPISMQYPLVEVLTILLFIIAVERWPPGMMLLGALILLSSLLVLAVIDIKTGLLPDVITLPLIWLGLMFNLSGTFVPLNDAVIGAMAGYVSLWLLFWGFKLLRQKEALGYGDFKLLAALGAWMGWRGLPHLVIIAALSGLVVIFVWRKIRHKNVDEPLAFGPWLALGGSVSLLLDAL
ncbi:prepilin peptidase [Pectobacterium sp. B1J-3]|uniref:prepilin peptidase n=1 Tax=Pectobacterium sp. B1J-3 TaxID=3385371 RepID=UPI003905CF91